MEIKVYVVNAFSDKLLGGNPAGIVLGAEKLTDEQMKNIAREINLSETAFVERLEEDYFNIRFFTPTCEVDLCGHATIATFYLLAKKGYIKDEGKDKKTLYQQTKVGKLEVGIFYKNKEVDKIFMEQSSPKELSTIKNLENLAEIMGINIEDIGVEDKVIFPEVVSTGLKDIILPIRKKEILDNLHINMKELDRYSKKLNVVGLHAFYLSELNAKEVYTRNFAPAVGIYEEAATGTSNGALIYYLTKNHLIKRNNIVAYQGEKLGRPSKIYCHIENKNNKYIVKIGGNGRITDTKTIEI